MKVLNHVLICISLHLDSSITFGRELETKPETAGEKSQVLGPASSCQNLPQLKMYLASVLHWQPGGSKGRETLQASFCNGPDMFKGTGAWWTAMTEGGLHLEDCSEGLLQRVVKNPMCCDEFWEVPRKGMMGYGKGTGNSSKLAAEQGKLCAACYTLFVCSKGRWVA